MKEKGKNEKERERKGGRKERERIYYIVEIQTRKHLSLLLPLDTQTSDGPWTDKFSCINGLTWLEKWQQEKSHHATSTFYISQEYV
jgi:hypothetical protein